MDYKEMKKLYNDFKKAKSKYDNLMLKLQGGVIDSLEFDREEICEDLIYLTDFSGDGLSVMSEIDCCAPTGISFDSFLTFKEETERIPLDKILEFRTL